MTAARWRPRAAVALTLLALAGCAGAGGRGAAAPVWNVVAVAPGVSLRGLCVVDDDVAWASGSGGTVLRTDDGGAHWQAVGPAGCADLDFRAIAARDRARAIIGSTTAPARILRTEDGGRSWHAAFSAPPPAFFDAVAFGDRGRAFVLGDPIDGRMQWFASADDGRSWRMVDPTRLPAFAADEAAFAASGGCLRWLPPDRLRVVTGGSRTRLLASDDGGATWTAVALPLRHGAASAGAFAIAFAGERGIVVGGDYLDRAALAGTVATSDDGGRSWYAQRGCGYRSGVAFLADGRCLAVGEDGSDLSADGGRTWVAVDGGGFHAVAAQGRGALAVGADGRIGRLVLP